MPGHALVQRRQGWGDGVWDPHGAICRAEPVSAVRGREIMQSGGGKEKKTIHRMLIEAVVNKKDFSERPLLSRTGGGKCQFILLESC